MIIDRASLRRSGRFFFLPPFSFPMRPFFRPFLFAFAGAVCLLSTAAAQDHSSTIIQIRWGVYPVLQSGSNPQSNGTRFLMAQDDGTFAEPTADAFNARYVARLLHVGDGTFDAQTGFATADWLDACEGSGFSDHTGVGSASTNLVGSFQLYGDARLPVTQFGQYEYPETFDPSTYVGPEDWYAARWAEQMVAVLIQDKETGRAYFLSETPGGATPVCMTNLPVSVWIEEEAIDPPLPTNNTFTFWARTTSQAVYLGSEVPYRSIWMADNGYTAEALSGYSDDAIAWAAATGMRVEALDAEALPELSIQSMALLASGATLSGRLTVQLNARLADGTTQPVTQLYGAARIVVETAESPSGPWTAIAEQTGSGEISVKTSANTSGIFRARLDY